MLFALHAKLGDVNITESFYETKLGLKIGTIKRKANTQGYDVFESLSKNQAIKSCIKNPKAHLISTGQNQIIAPIKELPKLRAVEKALKTGFDSQLLTRQVLPDEPWAQRIFTPDVFATNFKYNHVFTTNNCTVEARVYLSGSQVTMTVPAVQVPGGSFQDKRLAICRMAIDDLELLIKEKGCIIKTAANSSRLYLIPSGMVVIDASLSDVDYLRWGVSGDAQDEARVLRMAEDVCACHPEYKNASNPLGSYLQFLRDANVY